MTAGTAKTECRHNPLVCGTRHCPACAEADRRPTEDDLAWAMVLELGLPRRPQALDREQRRDLLMRALDIAETARRDPEWAAAIRQVLRVVVPG
jgi:hypothetical protein